MSKGAEVDSSMSERPQHQRPRRLADWLNPTGRRRVHSLIPPSVLITRRRLRESGMRENRTYRLSGGRRPAPAGRASSDPTPWKPGNAGGGKEPWFWVLVRKRRVREIGMRLTTPPAIRTLQRKLYVKAKTEPTFRFYRLYDKVYRADILAHAYALAKANGGAPGVDGETFEQIESAGRADWLARLREDLRTRRYQPAAVRRVYIPKVGGVGERPLGIPTIRDRVVQTAAVLMLSPIFEAGFTDAMYGYRPRRSAQQAVAAVHEALGAGYTEVVDADLSGYFDTIPQTDLLKSVARRVSDGALLHLLRLWLDVPVEERDAAGRVTRTGGRGHGRGTPQGGPLSPLLANVYMHRFLRTWQERGMDRHLKAKVVSYADDCAPRRRRREAEMAA